MQRLPSRLLPGDRLPNFGLFDAAGIERTFYFEVDGGPILLLACASLAQTEERDALQALAAAAEGLRGSGAELFVVSGDAPPVLSALTEQLGLAFPLFSDPAGSVLRHLLVPDAAATPAPRVVWYLLDPNQRVLTVAPQQPAAQALAQIEAALARCSEPVEPPRVLRAGAPVLTLPAVFDAEMCQLLIDRWREEHQEGGLSDGTKNVLDARKKRNLEHVVLDPELSRLIARTLARRIGPELVKVFNYTAPYRFEGYTVLSYRADRQDFFGTHRDNVRAVRQRRFAMSLNLNDDYEGGALRFPEYGPHSYSPKAGTALVFATTMLHEALPVTRGQRWVLTTFFCDPEPQAGQRRA